MITPEDDPIIAPDALSSPGQTRLLYLWPEMFFRAPGLGHMKEIARVLFIESQGCGRLPVLPPLLSNPNHNSGRTGFLNWSDYYDWSQFPHEVLRLQSPRKLCLRLAQLNCEVWAEHELRRSPQNSDAPVLVRMFPDSRVFGNWVPPPTFDSHPQFAEPKFTSYYPSRIRELARGVIEEMGPLDGVLHVRRGDLTGPEVSPDRVGDRLRKKHVSREARILIATNETDPTFAESVRQNFPNSVCEFEVPSLRKLQVDSRHNYLAFRVTCCLRGELARDLGSMHGPYREADPTTVGALRLKERLQRKRHWLSLNQVQKAAASAGIKS